MTNARDIDRRELFTTWRTPVEEHHVSQQDTYRLVPEGEEPIELEQVDTVDTWAQLHDRAVAHPYPFDQHPKSIIGELDDGETVEPHEDGNIEVLGMAWAGDATLETVAVSTDRGDTWNEADDEYPWNVGGYGANAYLPHGVEVTVEP